MIKIRPAKDYLVALESVAMTDIVLNMFIFFFISFSLLYTFGAAKVSKIDVNLPKASSAVALEGAERVILAVTKEGRLYIDDEKVSPANLKRILKERLRNDPSTALLIKVDKAARFDNVAKVLDIVNELEIRKVSIASVKGETGDRTRGGSV
jgi:biopolymer transport protein ExbD